MEGSIGDLKARQLMSTFSQGDELIKGAALPIGTVRTHGNKKMIKTATGWKPHKDGESAKVSTQAKEASKEKKKPSSAEAELYKEGIRVHQKNYEHHKKQAEKIDKIHREHGKEPVRGVHHEAADRHKKELEKFKSKLKGASKSSSLKKAYDELGVEV